MTVPTTASVNIPLMIEQNIRAEWIEARRHQADLKKQLAEADSYVGQLTKIAEAANVPLTEAHDGAPTA